MLFQLTINRFIANLTVRVLRVNVLSVYAPLIRLRNMALYKCLDQIGLNPYPLNVIAEVVFLQFPG